MNYRGLFQMKPVVNVLGFVFGVLNTNREQKKKERPMKLPRGGHKVLGVWEWGRRGTGQGVGAGSLLLTQP